MRRVHGNIETQKNGAPSLFYPSYAPVPRGHLNRTLQGLLGANFGLSDREKIHSTGKNSNLWKKLAFFCIII